MSHIHNTFCAFRFLFGLIQFDPSCTNSPGCERLTGNLLETFLTPLMVKQVGARIAKI